MRNYEILYIIDASISDEEKEILNFKEKPVLQDFIDKLNN